MLTSEKVKHRQNRDVQRERKTVVPVRLYLHRGIWCFMRLCSGYRGGLYACGKTPACNLGF